MIISVIIIIISFAWPFPPMIPPWEIHRTDFIDCIFSYTANCRCCCCGCGLVRSISNWIKVRVHMDECNTCLSSTKYYAFRWFNWVAGNCVTIINENIVGGNDQKTRCDNVVDSTKLYIQYVCMCVLLGLPFNCISSERKERQPSDHVSMSSFFCCWIFHLKRNKKCMRAIFLTNRRFCHHIRVSLYLLFTYYLITIWIKKSVFIHWFISFSPHFPFITRSFALPCVRKYSPCFLHVPKIKWN